jgi:hypothetical protein
MTRGHAVAVDLTPHPLFSKLAQSLVTDRESKQVIVDKAKEIFTAGYLDGQTVANYFKSQEKKQGISDDEVEEAKKKLGISDGLDAAFKECVDKLLDGGPWPIGFEGKQVAGVTWVKEKDDSEPVLKCLIKGAAKALTSPNAPLEFVTLTGYLGPGDVEGRMRLYTDPNLEHYVSLRTEDILLRHPFQTEHAPFDLVDVIWLRRSVTVGRDRRQPRRDKAAEFLEGELMEAADVAADLPTRIAGATSDEPFCVSYTCCKRTSRCPPGGGRGRG